jgi:hypothetical protein
MAIAPGTNLFVPLTSNVMVSLTDENGNALLVKGTLANLPSATSGYAVGCEYIATDTGTVLTNTGSATSSNFVGVSAAAGVRTPTAINSTATATAAQVATGYITSTSAAATTITLPTGTLLGAALGAKQGTTFDLYIDNTAGANTVTIAIAVNGILSAAAAAVAASFGLLTVPSGVTGVARFSLMFSSATAYVFTRTA